MYQCTTNENNDHLDVGQVHEVLGDVNNKFVHESGSDVESIHGVVEVVPNITTVVKALSLRSRHREMPWSCIEKRLLQLSY